MDSVNVNDQVLTRTFICHLLALGLIMHHVSAVTLNCTLLVAMETKKIFGD